MSFFEQNQPNEERKPYLVRKNYYLRIVCCLILAYLSIRMFFEAPEDGATNPVLRYGVAAFVLVFAIVICFFSIRGRRRMIAAAQNQSNADTASTDAGITDVSAEHSEASALPDEANEPD